jgi:hypothetical protein
MLLLLSISFSVQVCHSSQDIDDFDLSIFESESPVSAPQKKLLLLTIPWPSHLITFFSLGYLLSQNNYNVSMVITKELRQNPMIALAESFITLIEIPNLPVAVQQEMEDEIKLCFDMTFNHMSLGRNYAKHIFENEELIQNIKEQQFDMVIGEGNIYIELFMKITEIPLKIRYSPALDSTIVQTEEGPNSHSFENNIFKAAYFGLNMKPIDKSSYFSSLPDRFQNYVMHIASRIAIKSFLPSQQDSFLPEKYKKYAEIDNIDFTFLHGVDGLLSKNPLPMNYKYVYPTGQLDLKSKGIFEIEPQLQSFLDSQEKVIVVSFGSFYIHTNETLRQIFQFMQDHSEYGFVLSFIKENHHYFSEDVVKMLHNQSHILVQNWIP